jgi:hypothetical protein
MNAFSKIVVATGITFGATQAFADERISCTQSNSSSGTVIWEFSKTSLASERLASNIVYNPGSGTTVISAVNVAQYVVNASQLYFLIDDPAGNIIQTLSAFPKPNAKSFFWRDYDVCRERTFFNRSCKVYHSDHLDLVSERFVDRVRRLRCHQPSFLS